MEILFDVLLFLVLVCSISFVFFLSFSDWKNAQQIRQKQVEFYRLANESLSVWLVKNREEVS